jgi:hypothetical protein
MISSTQATQDMDTKIEEAKKRFHELCDERSGTEDVEVENMLDMDRADLRNVINVFADGAVGTLAAYIVAAGENPLATFVAKMSPTETIAETLLTTIVELRESNKHLTQCFLTVFDTAVGGVERNEDGTLRIPEGLSPSEAAEAVLAALPARTETVDL